MWVRLASTPQKAKPRCTRKTSKTTEWRVLLTSVNGATRSGFKASQHAAVFSTSIKQTQSFGCNTFEFQEECHCVLVLLYLVFLVAASLQSSQSSPNEDGSCLRAVVSVSPCMGLADCGLWSVTLFRYVHSLTTPPPFFSAPVGGG